MFHVKHRGFYHLSPPLVRGGVKTEGFDGGVVFIRLPLSQMLRI